MELENYEQKIWQKCKNYKTIFIYIAKDDEVDTKTIIKLLLSRAKRVVVPISNIQTNEIEISEIKDLVSVHKGAYNIDEPKEKLSIKKEDIDIFFVPGRVFDKKGNRRGRGKGYFDRFLSEIKGKQKIIGLCYTHQLKDKLKTNDWDVPVDEVILADG